MAILSRVGLEDVTPGFTGDPGWGEPQVPEARALSATCGGIRIVSLYVPNGRQLTDPHMDYKMVWLDRLREQAVGWASAGPTMLMGDWNIAPRDEDVWSMEFYEEKSHVSPRERAVDAFLESGFVDLVRPLLPGPKVYTYWDYQQLRFQKGRGMRIDFLLGSADLAGRVAAASIDRENARARAPPTTPPSSSTFSPPHPDRICL